MTNEEKKELQKSRMKTYFIESTKELIKEVGIENITTKKIGDRAGYSYATIYNYFENFNELICICIKEFSEEMKNDLETKSKDIENKIEKIYAITQFSIDYAVNNINIYNLFLSNSIDFTYFKNTADHRFIHPGYLLLTNIMEHIPEFSEFSPSEIHAFADILFSLFHAKMQFFVTLKYPDTKEELEKDIFSNLDFLINKTLKK